MLHIYYTYDFNLDSILYFIYDRHNQIKELPNIYYCLQFETSYIKEKNEGSLAQGRQTLKIKKEPVFYFSINREALTDKCL